jgi:hypothetical protein
MTVGLVKEYPALNAPPSGGGWEGGGGAEREPRLRDRVREKT